MPADEARGHTKVHILHKNGRFLGPLCAWNSDIEDAGIGLEIELTIQRYAKFEESTMKEFPRKLRMFVKRKDTFQDDSEEAQYNAMLKGVRRFLASLHEQGLCAFMNYDRVLALSEETYNYRALPSEPGIVILHKPAITNSHIPTGLPGASVSVRASSPEALRASSSDAVRASPPDAVRASLSDALRVFPPQEVRVPPSEAVRAPLSAAVCASFSDTKRTSTRDNAAASYGLRSDPSLLLNLADKTHTWAFGAVAELIHNSSDADAKDVRVSLDDLGPERDTNFVVIDNGTGMKHSEMAQLFTIGGNHSNSSTASHGERIGCNGLGFQQGVLRLGNTATVISVRGKKPATDLPQVDVPTASFGILSIDAYRKSASHEERQPVVAQYATLNLSTMQADVRYNTPETYDRVMDCIRTLVPYFTREYLVAYAGRFVVHTEGSAWDVCGVKSSTSIFVSRLRASRACYNRRHKLELIRDSEMSDIQLEDHEGHSFCLPTRPASGNEEGIMRPPMDYSLRNFCEQMFLDPRMKINVQGSEVRARGLLSPPCNMKEYEVNIDRLLNRDDLEFSRIHRPLPYNITVNVVMDSWHREKGLSGIMVYFENCLVDSYSRGSGAGLPLAVPPEEKGYLAIVTFRGPADKQMFHPNPTKVGFPDNNAKYAHVMKAAGEALSQVVHHLPDPESMPLVEGKDIDNSILCCVCGKWRLVPKAYKDKAQHIDGWHCGIKGSPVASPKKGSNKCDTPAERIDGETLTYTSSTQVTRTSAPRDVLASSFSFDEDNPLGTGSSACVYVGGGVEGDDTALKVFATKAMWTREKDILWALKETGGSHRHICRISWVCEEKLTLALKPLGLCSLEKYMVHSESARVLTSRQRLNIAEKIADALQFLHGRKLCHNDVQPSNIVLGEDLTDDVFLVDFGQACRLSPSGQALATSFNNVDPPLRYAPPEVLGEAPVTRGSERDVFSFGVTVVELFSEQTMFAPEAVEDEAKLRHSLRTLRDFGDLKQVDTTRLRQTLPGLTNLAELPGMKRLALICRGCVNGDMTLRLKAGSVFRKLTRYKGIGNYIWRHGSSIVFHTLEPGDKLQFSEEGTFDGLTRFPRTGAEITREYHINYGSAFDFRSRFISCSRLFSFCVFYAQKQNNMFNATHFGLAPILEIDLAKIPCDDFEKHVFDGTRQAGEGVATSRFERFAAAAEEVTLDIEVPRSAVKAVYNLDYNPRKGESKKKHEARAGHLVRLQKNMYNYAFERSSPFDTWEKHYNKLNRQRGDDDGSHQQRIKDQARVPDRNEQIDAVLRACYCARRDRSGGRSSRGGGAGSRCAIGIGGGGGAGRGGEGDSGGVSGRSESGRGGDSGPSRGRCGAGGSDGGGRKHKQARTTKPTPKRKKPEHRRNLDRA